MALPLKNKTELTVSTFCHVFRQNWVGFFVKRKKKEFIVFILHMCFWHAELWISSGGGGCYYICKQRWFGVLLWDKAFDRVPSRGLAEEPLLLSCETQWLFARSVAPQCPLSRADVQWVVLVRVPLWVDSLYKVWFNVKHEWVFDLVSRAEITAHSFVQPLHQCFCFSLTSIFFKGNCIC